MANWLLYALLAMAAFSVSNVLLKIILSNHLKELPPLNKLLWLAAIGAIGLIAAYFLALKDFSMELMKLLAVFLVFSVAAFALILLALKEGKPALVAAVLSVGAVFTAVISIVFLKDSFSAKEWIAMALAVASVALLSS